MRSVSAIAIYVSLGLPLSHAALEPIWEELEPMPEGRSGMIAFSLNDSEPAFYGGSSWDDGEKRIHASGYVLRDHQWRSLTPLETPIAYAAVASGPDFLYAAGGTDGTQLNPILFTQNPNVQRQFFKLPPPQTRLYAGAALLNGAYYQIGGSTQLSPLAPTNSISKSEGDAWKDLGPLPEGPLINSAVATWKNRIFVFGGGLPGPNGLENTDSVFAFNTSDDSWEKQVPLPIAARGAVATSFPDIGILLVGGYTGSNRATPQVLLYDPEKNEFRSLPELPEGLMLPAVVLTDHSIYVFGGEDAPKHRSANVFRTDIRRLLENPTVQP
jgi:N-acetylneuraminic acid mutarotase